MVVFILEDDMDRMNGFFNRIFPKYFGAIFPEVHHATDIESAKKILTRKKEFDIIFLDHDLGGQQYVDSSEENTGYQVAKIIKNEQIKYNQCILHTLNPAGAKNMKSVLQDADILPFTKLMSHN